MSLLAQWGKKSYSCTLSYFGDRWSGMSRPYPDRFSAFCTTGKEPDIHCRGERMWLSVDLDGYAETTGA